MKNTKRVWKRFSYRECGAFAKYLEKQSEKGWHFKEWKFGLVFERGLPEKRVYDVEVFPDGEELDERPGEEALEYAEYCREAGWELIDGKRKFCIFRRRRKDAVPIVTQEERLENIWKIERKNLQRYLRLFGFLFLFELYDAFRFPESFFLSDTSLLNFFLYGTGTLFCILGGIDLIFWKRHADREIEKGNPIYFDKKGKLDWQRTRIIIFFIIVVLGVIRMLQTGRWNMMIMLAAMGIFFWTIDAAFAFWRPQRFQNWLLSRGLALLFMVALIIVSVLLPMDPLPKENVPEEELPLVQTDYRQTDEIFSSAEIRYEESILADKIQYTVIFKENGEGNESALSEEEGENRTDELTYQIYEGKYDWILDRIWKDQMDVHKGTDCRELWDAEQAVLCEWSDGTYSYYVKYPENILILTSEEPLDERQTRIIREKLAL